MCSTGCILDHACHDQNDDRQDEQIHRNRDEGGRLRHAAKIDDRQNDDNRHGDGYGVVMQARKSRRDRVRTRRGAYGNRQDVIHQKRTAGQQSR
ncbi:hypothetical protein D3C73_1239380 [compost metagenome]